jgi:uncharacterized DUF497 family protein
MNIDDTIWLPHIVDKLASKHGVTTIEVEEVLMSSLRFYRAERGVRPGEDLYMTYGQTFNGRHLVVFFVLKRTNAALVISARDMTSRERRHHGKK